MNRLAKTLRNVAVVGVGLVAAMWSWSAYDAHAYSKTLGYKMGTWREGGKTNFAVSELFGTEWTALCLAYGFPYQYKQEEDAWLANILGVTEDEVRSYYLFSFFDDSGGGLVAMWKNKNEVHHEESLGRRHSWRMETSQEIVCTKNPAARIRLAEGEWQPEFEYRFNVYTDMALTPET